MQGEYFGNVKNIKYETTKLLSSEKWYIKSMSNRRRFDQILIELTSIWCTISHWVTASLDLLFVIFR